MSTVADACPRFDVCSPFLLDVILLLPAPAAWPRPVCCVRPPPPRLPRFKIWTCVPLRVGGFLRLTLVPLHHRFNAWVHKRNAFRWSCWDHGIVNCPQRNSHECGTDNQGKRYQQWVEIPKVFPDGYVWRGSVICWCLRLLFSFLGARGVSMPVPVVREGQRVTLCWVLTYVRGLAPSVSDLLSPTRRFTFISFCLLLPVTLSSLFFIVPLFPGSTISATRGWAGASIKATTTRAPRSASAAARSKTHGNQSTSTTKTASATRRRATSASAAPSRAPAPAGGSGQTRGTGGRRRRSTAGR